MSFIKIQRYSRSGRSEHAPSYCAAWLAMSSDSDTHRAIVATNINILRRIVPYAYFFSNEEFSPVDLDRDELYVNSLAKKVLCRGVWLGNPDFEAPVKTQITAIYFGDVFPFVNLLDAEEYALLCLPDKRSIEQIEEIINGSNCNKEAVKNILSLYGGCILNVIDHVKIGVWTMDDKIFDYFSDP